MEPQSEEQQFLLLDTVALHVSYIELLSVFSPISILQGRPEQLAASEQGLQFDKHVCRADSYIFETKLICTYQS